MDNGQNIKPTKKYRFRAVLLYHDEVAEITWFDDYEVDEELRRKEGTLVSLSEAAQQYYRDSFDPAKCKIDREILRLGILGYAHSKGQRVDLWSALIIDRNVS